MVRVCVDLSSGDPAGNAADLSDTPAGTAHRTEWQLRTPETQNTEFLYDPRLYLIVES